MTDAGWCWFAHLPDAAAAQNAFASATATARDGAPAGVLAAWPAGRKPVATAVRLDERLVDPGGDAAWVSLVLIARDRAPLFDDPAVSGALRAVLLGAPPDGVSTFVRDSSHFAGAVTVVRSSAERLRGDPFARIAPAIRLRVEAGLLGHTTPVPGPVIQRYAGKPWPAAGF